jgi:hypothetical protein
MNLFEQFIQLFQPNQFFEPVIIDNRLLNIFVEFASKLNGNKGNSNESNIKLLEGIREELLKLPSNDLLSLVFPGVFRENLKQCLDTFIFIIRSNDTILRLNENTIARLTEENEKLKNTRVFTRIDFRNIMSIPFELIR